eukprot:scaffold3782_cov83-Cylindrotheca_fusiformis.AAC.2
MKEKDTVIMDVRSAYESAVGSSWNPRCETWLNESKTTEKLNGKIALSVDGCYGYSPAKEESTRRAL